MKEKYFDMPFRARSSESDFSCSDGEIASLDGAEIVVGDASDSSGSQNPDEEEDALKPDYTIDYVPSLPPPPEVRFALVRDILKGWQASADSFPAVTVANDDSGIEDRGKRALEILRRFNSAASGQNLFTAPFLALGVWKLKTGAYISPSVPVMLIPNSSLPVVSEGSALDSQETELRITAALGKLYRQISLQENLREWVGKIESLEIMVSSPLRQYSEDKAMIFGKRLNCDSFGLFLDVAAGKSSEIRISTETISQGWIPDSAPSSVKVSSPARLDEFYTIASIPLEDLRPQETYSELIFNCGTLSECYATPSRRPSFAMSSFRKSAGAIPFKGKILAWGPELQSPAFASLQQSMGNYCEGVQPRWIFHPDPKAKEYQYTDSAGLRHKLPLHSHPSLYGAYFWRGFSAIGEEDELAATVKTGVREESLPGYLWISDKSELPVFEDCKLKDAECGEVRGLCRAFRNSGLVATTVPTLYVFSSEGIFLYKENSSGDFMDAGLVAKYILPDISRLEVLPKGVRFTTTAGELILLSGSSVKVLSSEGGNGVSASKTVMVKSSGGELKLVTRPLKLSGASLVKQLRRVFVRGQFESGRLNVSVYGSHDLRHWFLMARRRRGAAVFLNRFESRFFRIEIEGTAEDGSLFEGLSLLASIE